MSLDYWLKLADSVVKRDNFKTLQEFFGLIESGEPHKTMAEELTATRHEREETMRLDLGIMAGAESKAWLADLTKLVERMEKAVGLAPKGSTAPVTAKADDEDSEDADDDFVAKKTKGKKAAASFDDDEDDADESESEDDTDEDEDEAPAKKTKGKKAAAFEDDEDDADADESEDESEDEDEDEKPVKKTKSKKVTLDDVNDACKAHVQAKIKSGQPGPEARKSALKVLKKKFGVASATDLKPEQFAAAIKAMQA